MLKDTRIANPARNARLEKVMKTMARKCTRARYYSPELMREEYVRAVCECVDWDDAEEVTTLFYITKDLVQGRRAADEQMLEWDDVQKADATAATVGGMVRATAVQPAVCGLMYARTRVAELRVHVGKEQCGGA